MATTFITGPSSSITYRFPNNVTLRGRKMPQINYLKMTGKNEEVVRSFSLFYGEKDKYVNFSKERLKEIVIISRGVLDFDENEVMKNPLTPKMSEEDVLKITEMVKMIQLMKINFLVFQNYLQENYEKEEDYPILVEGVKIIYSWHLLDSKNRLCFFPTTNFYMKLNGKDVFILPIKSLELEFGEKINGFLPLEEINKNANKKLSKKGLVIYENDGKRLCLDKTLSRDKAEVEKAKNVLIEYYKKMMYHVKIHNEEMENHKMRVDGYLSYLSKFIAKDRKRCQMEN